MTRIRKRELFEPVEPTTIGGGWPGSMLDRIAEICGGIWRTGDHYAEPAAIVRRVREVGTSALNLDARELSFLADLPDLRFLRLATEGRPILMPGLVAVGAGTTLGPTPWADLADKTAVSFRHEWFWRRWG
jgi:hypothetical protein